LQLVRETTLRVDEQPQITFGW